MTTPTAHLNWRDTAQGRVPISTQFDDPYFSLDNGMAETAHVFHDGNQLSGRWGDGLHIAELGFGTGLNFLLTWQAWAADGARAPLRFTSFEAYPMSLADMAAALAAFPTLAGLAATLTQNWAPGDGPRRLAPGLLLEVMIGDARHTLPRWQGSADAWFLDGFSPAKNPELWQPDLLAQVAMHTRPGGTAATYSAAGHVRQALSDAGFDVTRVPGYGRKRHMTTARIPHAK